MARLGLSAATLTKIMTNENSTDELARRIAYKIEPFVAKFEHSHTWGVERMVEITSTELRELVADKEILDWLEKDGNLKQLWQTSIPLKSFKDETFAIRETIQAMKGK